MMIRKRKEHLETGNCGKHLEWHTPHWFWINLTKVWCPGKPWKGGGD